MNAAPEQQPFADRRAAGRALATALRKRHYADPVVLALPRGGIPVAFEVSRALRAPLEPMLVRKIGAAGNPELAVGAVAADGQVILDRESIEAFGMSRPELTEAVLAAQAELQRQHKRYLGDRDPIPVAGRTVILVDDGVATGSTAVAAARALRGRGAAEVVLAVPVGPAGIEDALGGEFDEVVCLMTPHRFASVGHWYDDFSQTSDQEVVELLGAGGEVSRAEHATEQEVTIAISPTPMHGDLRVPPDPHGLIVFAHGSGSSRHSPRNREVAAELNAAGFATLLVDLLSEREASDRRNVFDIELLATRLLAAVRWASSEPLLQGLPVGLFGASTGAGAALVAAARAGSAISAVVSRGGRPDLAGAAVRKVTAPTLLIVGGADLEVLELNELAASRISAEHRIAIVPRATHLFEEPGALDRVAELASEWFSEHLDSGANTHEPRQLSAR